MSTHFSDAGNDPLLFHCTLLFFLLNYFKAVLLRHSFYLNFSVPAFWMDCLIFLNLFTLLFFDVILIQRGHAAQTVYDRFNLLYNKINVLFCDLLT